MDQHVGLKLSLRWLVAVRLSTHTRMGNAVSDVTVDWTSHQPFDGIGQPFPVLLDQASASSWADAATILLVPVRLRSLKRR